MIVECPGCKNRYDVSGRPAGTRARCRCGTVFALPEPRSTAGQLSCPGCGAGVAPGRKTCEYCDAALLVRACPRCFARIYHGHSHCPHCGVTVTAPAQADPDGKTHARHCPACKQPELLARLVSDVLLDECPDCHGIWIDSGALERVVRERSEEHIAALGQLTSRGQLSAVGEPSLLKASPRPMYLACPDCDTIMNRVNFAKRSGVILDVCRHHGTWFDDSELPRVIAFVAEGGLDEARKRDVEELEHKARMAKMDANAARMRASWAGSPDGYDRRADVLGGALAGIAGWLLK